MFSVLNKDFLKIIFIMKLDNVGTSVIVDRYLKSVRKNLRDLMLWVF